MNFILRFILPVFAVVCCACGPAPVEVLCTDVAVEQCAKCYECSEAEGGELCGLPVGTDQETCEVELASRCSNQAATLERPKRDITTCDESFDNLTCEDLVAARAQDLPNTTEQCAYFL